eukprot:COSAG02_NODE_15163_length_1198_cov_0.967243_1_plen_53_part_10
MHTGQIVKEHSIPYDPRTLEYVSNLATPTSFFLQTCEDGLAPRKHLRGGPPAT